ncbi:GNAT family N-acetyltransferase [Sporosarcina sp. Marseille-Q4063]|uniref:GNAT family N-acetyltransferase n=1 Tax=Sporosarcina sp. Marseille-Q4063 TaxID=2810514 RepID=UPI001BAF62CF|nr:GNAT family protein [Sporosarcina sp. Marseille-Q4063]QUW22043.1 GNAT family N-acetyltransferase [Sporosarcina sp. Marseille-Q4063]
MFPTLETERLLLREITNEDANAIFSSFSNNEVTRYYGQDTMKNIEEAEKIIDIFATNHIEKRGIRWGIQRKDDQEIIGTIGFHAWFHKHKRAEIGYEIHPDYWRNGYTHESLLKIISYGFEEMDLNRIGAVVFTQNEASNKLLTKIGFQNEGLLKDYMYQNGNPHDTYIYSYIKK